MTVLSILVGFFISLIISTVIIYFVTKLLGEKEGFIIAFLTALLGAVIFGLTSILITTWWVAALLGGIAWLVALGGLYNMGWIKSFFIAVFIWLIASLVSYVLPTVAGPL